MKHPTIEYNICTTLNTEMATPLKKTDDVKTEDFNESSLIISEKNDKAQPIDKYTFYDTLETSVNNVQEKLQNVKDVLSQQKAGDPDEALISLKLSTHRMESALNGLTSISMTPEENKIIAGCINQINEDISNKPESLLIPFEQIEKLQVVFDETPDAIPTNSIKDVVLKKIGDVALKKTGVQITDREISEKLISIMTNINSGLVSGMEYGMKIYTEFWKDFSDKAGQLTHYLKVNKDNINFTARNFHDLFERMQPFQQRWILYPEPGGKCTKEEAEKWAAEFKVAKAVQVNDTKWVVIPDPTSFDKIMESLENLVRQKDGTFKESITLNPTTYNSWLTGFNAQVENIKTDLQTAVSALTSSITICDTSTKALASSISILKDTQKVPLGGA